jgi:WD40 repeat protein
LADVFVSYSRHGETALVDRLQDALSARAISCWVDREDIFPSSPWRSEIDQAVLESHAFLFVISPESVTSPYCRAELERAVALAKRLVPVLAKDTPPELVPTALAALQFISFTEQAAGDEDGFERQVGLLVEALTTDIEAVHLHTRLLTQAEQWVQKSNDRSLLLRGRELAEAEKWLDEQTNAGRPVLAQQRRLVRDSRQAAIRRQRGSLSVAVAISSVMALLAVLAAVEWHVAVNQRHQAETERDIASSLYLAQESQGQLALDPQLALVLALRAYDFSPTVQAQDAVRSAVAQSSLRAALPPVGGESQWPFDASGQWAVSSEVGLGGLDVVNVWGLYRRSGAGSPSRPFALRLADSDVTSAQFSADGKEVLAVAIRFPSATDELVSWDWGTASATFKVLAHVFADAVVNRQGSLVASVEGNGEIALQDPVGGRVLRLIKPRSGLGGVGSLVFSPDGRLVAALGDKETEVWQVNGRHVATFHLVASGPAAFSPDGSKLAVAAVGPEVDVVSLSSPASAPLVHPLTLPASRGIHCCDVDEATGLAWSPDGTTLAVATEDPVIWLWVGSAAAPVYLQYDNEGEGSSVAFSPDGRLLLDGSLVWDWAAALDRYLDGEYDDIALSPNRDVVAAVSQTDGILLWDWHNLTSHWLVEPPARPPSPPGSSAYSLLTFSPDGMYLAAASGTSVDIWRVAAPALVAKLALPHGSGWGGAKSIEFTTVGSALLIDAQGAVGEKAYDVVLDWHWGTHLPPAPLPLPGNFGYLAGFSGSSALVLSTPSSATGPSKLLAWDGATPAVATVAATIPQRDDWDEAAELPGDKLLLADQVGVAVYDPRARRFGPEINSYELSFVLSPSRQLAAMTTASGQVEVWDLNARDAPLIAFTAQGQPFPIVAWGGSGSVLGVADPADEVEVMPALSYLPFAQLLPMAKSLAVTSLDKAERKEFLP